MFPRTTQKSETHRKLLDSSVALMLDKGFSATSVNEICSRAGVTKGSFFHFFASKEEMGRAALYHYWEPLHKLHDTAPFTEIQEPLERLYAYCDFLVVLLQHPDTPKSCLFGNMTQVLATEEPEIVNVCRTAFTWWADIVQSDLDAAVSKYMPGHDLDTRGLAEMFVVIYEGSLLLAKALKSPDLVGKQLRNYKQYVRLLFSNPENEKI